MSLTLIPRNRRTGQLYGERFGYVGVTVALMGLLTVLLMIATLNFATGRKFGHYSWSGHPC